MRSILRRLWVVGLIAMTAPLACAVDIVALRAYLKTASAAGSAEVSSPAPGQTVFFAVDLQITGPGTPITLSDRALLDGAVFTVNGIPCAGSFSNVAATNGATITCGQGWVATAGTHTLEWDLDPNNSVAETNESNNTAMVTFTVGGPPTVDIVAQRVFLKTSFSGSTEVSSPTPGQTVYIAVTMQSTGTGGPITFNDQVLLDGVPYDSCSGVDQIPVPAIFSFTCDQGWVATPGTHTLRVDLDTTNSIAETNENDNTATFTFTVSAPGTSSNLAQGKAATQSSTLPGYAAAGATSAVDGTTDGNFSNGSVTATNLDSNAWWQVDLGASTAIGSVVVWNRTDCCGSR